MQQEGAAGEEKLKAPSHRMCDRNLGQPQVIDEETETQRGAANREHISFVRLTFLKLLFWGAGCGVLFKRENIEFKYKMPVATTVPLNRRM